PKDTRMTETLPHDPYISAVIDALASSDLEPDTSWTSDAETDPYATGADAGCTTMLSAVLAWDDAGTDEDDDGDQEDDGGLFLFWDHPAGHWQYARPRPEGGNTPPEFLAHLGLYADPAAVAETAASLLAGRPLPKDPAPTWPRADTVRTAVEKWAAPAGMPPITTTVCEQDAGENPFGWSSPDPADTTDR
ncbi:hypothetical protein, partial [Streptomyces sp. NE06-03C]|uniref:hypothetical protein n=1 Tax=Streptomyces sp. NE06-03C TaxID=3028694 RepID=UPI0029A53C67